MNFSKLISNVLILACIAFFCVNFYRALSPGSFRSNDSSHSNDSPRDIVIGETGQRGLGAPVQVTKVLDGDTFVLKAGTKSERVRILYIDAPEKGQPFADQARRALSELTKDAARYRPMGKDKHGRTLAEVYNATGTDVGMELVSKGLAWCHPIARKTNPRQASICERKLSVAKGQKRGLWSDSSPMAPWEYRSQPMASF